MRLPENIAVVTDSLLNRGGADRMLLSILELFPKAVVFTSSYNPEKYPEIKNEVRTSFLDHWFLKKFVPRHINIFTPIAFENLDLRGFDMVITLSAGSSKGVITYLDQPHVLVVLTPPRHQWEREINSRSLPLNQLYRFLSNFTGHYLRLWDISAIKRADHLISISKFIQRKVKKIYRRESNVIYPGLNEFWFETTSKVVLKQVKEKYNLPDKFALTVSRMFDHKRMDWIVQACKSKGETLVVVGDGPDRGYLEKMAEGCENIHFLGFLPDHELKAVYALAQVFLFAAVEDYGYVPVEAMAQGVPSLVFNEGGPTETVKQGETGEFFGSIEELEDLLKKKEWKKFKKEKIKKRARMFDDMRFKKEFVQYLREILTNEKNGK